MQSKSRTRTLAAVITTAMAASCLPAIPAAAAAKTVVRSQGSVSDPAYLRGGAAGIVHDTSLDSDVLDLHGNGFGSGWLELPKFFADGCEEGFTFSMKYKLDADTANYSRLFQFATVPFGTGNAPSYSSPDLSVDVKDKTAFRASIFAGTGNSTLDDKQHRAIYDLSAAPDTDWHELTLVCTPDSAVYYIDGKAVSYESETISDVMPHLFDGKTLSAYVCNSIGHSVYSDKDIRAKVDDVAFYRRALSAADVAALPDDADFLYTFEADTLEEGEAVTEPESWTTLKGAKITSIPSLYTESPDGRLLTKLWTDGSRYYYSVHKATGEVVIEPSQLGFVTTTEDLSSGFTGAVPSAAFTEGDETYSMPYGKHRNIRNHYREMSFPLQKGDTILTVTFRMYDDGVAFRYSLNKGASIKQESSEVVFPDNSTFWGNWPNATYEWDMVELSSQKIKDAWADYSCPLTGHIADHSWVLLSEANVFNEDDPYCADCVCTEGGSRALRWKFGVKEKSVSFNTAFHTPWRAVIIADDLNGMACSDLILNLNPPNRLEDISWVKPGKTAWSWWSSGGDSPVEYHTQKDYIDFAAANGWQFVCLDFGWALWDDSEAKVKELCEYAAERGIGIYLWYGVNNSGHSGYRDSKGNPAYPYYSLLDEKTITREFERISAIGVKGVKVDYYESDTQATMRQMHLCADIAAKNHLMVLFHGCTIPRGESRTYPNIVSYEAVNGTEYYKWFTSPSLENRVSYTFTRNVVGSADFTPTGVPVYNSKATAGFALADVVTIESGIQHFAHSVYTYEGSKALPMLNDVPVVWDELKVLDGYPMQFNVTARRNGSNWYIAASTIKARKVDIHLSDLIGSDEGTYNAYIFADNKDGSDLEVTVLNGLTARDTISRDLLNNGGCVIKLTQGAMKLTTPYSNYRSYEAEHAKLSGKASVTGGKDGKYSSGGAYVGYVGGGNDNAVTFENVTADKAGKYTLRIYYVSGEPRSLKVDVNGTFASKIDGCYANRGDWTGIRAVNVEVELNEGKNTIRLYYNEAFGPSIDRIALAIPETSVSGDLNFDGNCDLLDLVL
ncbi:MAG: glycoside hydrolase family 97 catalytic domain-containing protein, partial [Oscillospiraceae bacterium]|nr:glycoside hydrolase family 97 catalytic domain-containing protein [Oscillospiraceae bacterium]